VSVDAVIFDWGGTLTPFSSIEMEDMWRLAAQHIAAEHIASEGASVRLKADEDAITARLMDVERAFWDRTAADARAGSLGDLLAEATRTLGVDVGEAVLEEAGVRYLDAWTPHITHDPDAVEVIGALRARGLRVGLLSNTHWPRTFHERFLARDGLADLIEVRCYTSEMTHMKPHGDAFRAALEGLGDADPRRTVMVGDRPFDDIHGAKQLGMRAVLRANDEVPGYDVTPDAEIGALGELLPLIDGWMEEQS
jgi:putative hydrolase of the HAD superfamily